MCGLTLFSHQAGGFFGAWPGGLAVARFGDYTWMLYADAGLALLAALINLRDPRAAAGTCRARLSGHCEQRSDDAISPC